MSEYRSATIRDLVIDELNQSVFLPAIQREYVWTPREIERLFDSIMCEYPINTFLFWRIREENKKKWEAFEFIRNFDSANPHNRIADMNGVNRDIYLVLDGQQRLTSLFIGLRGTYAYRHHGRKETRLYLNLLHKPVFDNPEELSYQFLFRENDNPDKRISDPQLWYPVGKILDYGNAVDAMYSIKNLLESYPEDVSDEAMKTIGRLHSFICTNKTINFYEEKSDNYDRVVEIFVRTNTGGQKLEYSDILLSKATARWKTFDARREINDFADSINAIGGGYSFGKDFVLKGSLYLSDLPVQYRLANFTSDNLLKIEENWESIKTSIRQAVEIASRFGFSDKNLVSKLVLLPVAQYLRDKGNANFTASSSIDDQAEKNKIRRWITLVLLRNGLSSSTDNKLESMRAVIRSSEVFPFRELNRCLGISEWITRKDMEDLISIKYGTMYCYPVLSFLYDNELRPDAQYQQDHIFPRSSFMRKELRKRGYDDEKIRQYEKDLIFDRIPNLELLEWSENNRKNATPFDDWLANRDADYKTTNLIPELPSYHFDNYEHFIEERTKMIFARFDCLNLELLQPEDNMEAITNYLSIIGKTFRVSELNQAYNAIALSMNNLSFDGITTRSEMERTLNHLTNYNIVRIANKAYEDYEASGRTDNSRLIEIAQCRDSLKEHEDIETEQELLDGLCEQFHIN